MDIGRNQYLIAPKDVVSGFDVSCSTTVSFGGYLVYMGEACLCTTVRNGESSVLLLGYVVDAEDERRDTEELLQEFLSTIYTDSSNVADCVKYWGGRWCLLFEAGGKVNVITDTCGLKQVFYPEQWQKLTLASQARYIAELYSLKENNGAKSYISKVLAEGKEYSWPVYATLYDKVKRLLPNHILTEREGNARRYNPSGYWTKVPVAKMSALLKNQMRVLQNERPCAVTLTAGWDSRLVLAAADMKDDKLRAVTLQYNGVNDNHIDLTVPAAICKEAGVKHDMVRCEPVDAAFEKRYKEHGENAHPYWSQMTYAVERNGYGTYMWVKGSCNEVLRNSSGVLYNWQVTPEMLCKLFQIPCNSFSERVLTEWLKDAKPYCKANGLRLLDLFYWEHRCGSWLSECLNENDLVGETFTPFNCRAYLELGLTVSEAKRTPPHYAMFEEMIKNCGLQVEVPVNSGRYASLKAKMKCLLKNRLHLLYGLVLNLQR